MTDAALDRRTFLVASTRATTLGWLTLQLPLLTTLAACAREDARRDAAFTHLSSAEARTMAAFAAQIIPSGDGTPGAAEAGAVYFIDRALGMPFFATSVALMRTGLADLDARAHAAGSRNGFARSSSEKQIALMQQIERTPFFAAARTLVIIGTFADPSYGGNRDGRGWTMIGIDHRPSFTTPYGWYDAQTSTREAKHTA